MVHLCCCRMALLSVSYHVNLANAWSGLNEENRVAPAFFAAFSIVTRWWEMVPRAERHLSMTNGVRLGSLDYYSRRYERSKAGAAIVSRLLHGPCSDGV